MMGLLILFDRLRLIDVLPWPIMGSLLYYCWFYTLRLYIEVRIT